MESKFRVVSIVLALSLVALLLLPGALPQLAAQEEVEDDDSVQRTINVSGTGQASAQPDVAVVRLGVETEAEEASAALTENNEQMQALIEALQDAGVAEEDIQTQFVRLSPRYAEPDEGEREPGAMPDLIGYRATNLVEVRIRDLEAVGGILDAAVAAGSNRIEGIQFEVSDLAELLDQAREAAWNDAQHKAEQLTELAGVELGEVLTINETSRTPRPAVEQAVGGAEAPAVPIAPGTQSIEVDVHVTWSLQE